MWLGIKQNILQWYYSGSSPLLKATLSGQNLDSLRD